jgi:DSF synthase
MNNLISLLNGNARFAHTVHDEAARTYWQFMHRNGNDAARPCFHPALMNEMRAQQRIVTSLEQARSETDAAFFVLASEANVFNLGGDLQLFASAIRSGEREHLRAYAHLCVDGVHHYHAGFGEHVHSIALVQGAALGGGFEAALSCNTIIAEESASFGLPEVLFDLFPGMGAYNFIARRAGGQVAERLILSGRLFTAQELLQLGVIDQVVPDGSGRAAAEHFIREQKKHPRTRLAIDRMRRRNETVALEELHRIGDEWVDAALGLGEKSLRTMERFVRAQDRRHASAAGADSGHATAVA